MLEGTCYALGSGTVWPVNGEKPIKSISATWLVAGFANASIIIQWLG